MKAHTYLTGAAAEAFWNHLFEEHIKPHTQSIAPIIADRDVAVVVVRPNADAGRLARGLGWDGQTPTFRMQSGARKRFARSLLEMGDLVSARWLTEKRLGRIFVLCEGGSFLLNFTPGIGYSIEPGSNDFGGEPHSEQRAGDARTAN